MVYTEQAPLGHAADRPLRRISPMEFLTQCMLDEWDAKWFGCAGLARPILGVSGPWLDTSHQVQKGRCSSQPELSSRPISASGGHTAVNGRAHGPHHVQHHHPTHRPVMTGHHAKSSSDGVISQMAASGSDTQAPPTSSTSAGAHSGSNGFQPSPVTESPSRTPSVIQTALQTTSLSLPCNLATTLGASLNLSHGDQSSAGSLSPVQLLPPRHGLVQDPQPAQPTTGELQPAILGTWVNRQYRMLDPIVESRLPGALIDNQQQAGSIANAVGFQAGSGPPNEGTGPGRSAAQGIRQQEGLHNPDVQELQRQASESGSDVAAEAAWRWRFVRRWHAEQARAQAPDQQATSVDKTEEALAYLQAGGGGGWNMQVAVARTQSTDGCGLHSAGTQGNGSLLAGDLLLEDGSYTTMGSLVRTMYRTGGGGTAEESATCQVNSINRRALHLLEQQQQLERAAQARWNSLGMGDDNWVGHHLATVEIDDWGTFRFLVMRVNGRNDKHRILIRGRNYCSEGQISQDINRKVMQIATERGAHYETIEVMGGGVMEWRRERDRHLHLHSGYTCLPGPVGSSRPTSGQEVLNLAAVLTKQHLPVHFKVSIEGA